MTARRPFVNRERNLSVTPAAGRLKSDGAMTTTNHAGFQRDTIDEDDLARYDRLGAEWWNPKGPMAALHKFNPVRVGYIADLLGSADKLAARPLAGVRILDIGTGGGILSESLARLGASMTGIDPAPNNIAVAAQHAASGGLAIDYRCTSVESLAQTGETFDAVLAMEVVEHVREVPAFLRAAASLVRPGGTFVGATLNRTLKSYALAIVGAEYVLRWVERGTHDWHKFVTPSEFGRHLAAAGLKVTGEVGVTYNPLSDRWGLSRDTAVNYMIVARRLET
jgi:2-polyprenyl-6-hydroxyphenyl methylase / 3-demethylubiquinone-9 3-methyltransferase